MYDSLRKYGLRILLGVILLLPVATYKVAGEPCLSLAREQHNAGNYSLAIAILLGCPDEISDAYTELLASAYYHSGDLTSSRIILQAVSDSILTPNMLMMKARISFSRSDFLSAFQTYSILLNTDSANVNIIRQLAISSDKLDSTDLAISYYRRALELNPNDLISGIRLVQKYYESENLMLADSLADVLLKIDTLPELLYLRGDILYRMKEYQQAYKYYEPMLIKGSSNPDLLRKAGVCKYVNGETELAISLLSTSHLLEPDNEITCYYLGMAYNATGDFKSSELYFNSAIKSGISPNLSNYYHRMADMYESSGDYIKALESFQSALKYREKTDTFRPELYGEIGRVYEVYFNDYKNAIRNYDIFLETYSDTTGSKYKRIKQRKETLVGLVK